MGIIKYYDLDLEQLACALHAGLALVVECSTSVYIGLTFLAAVCNDIDNALHANVALKRRKTTSNRSQRIILGYCAATFATNVVKRFRLVGEDEWVFRIGGQIPFQNSTRIDNHDSPTLSQ